MKTGQIVQWEESETESGITLSGVTKAVRQGEIISSHAFPMQYPQGGMAFMVAFIVRRLDTDEVIVINGLGTKIVVDRSEPKAYTEVLSK